MFAFKNARRLMILLAAGMTAFAHAQDYKPGDKVEYKAQGWPEKWEQGVFVKPAPGGKQVIVRQKPSEFYPGGFERAFALDEVRPYAPNAARPAQSPAGAVAGQAGDKIAPPSVRPAAQAKQEARTPAPPPAAERKQEPRLAGSAGSLMSQGEILSYLRERLGDKPFQHPQRDAIKKELAETIKRRGVDFRLDTLSAFSNELAKLGASSEITYPIQENYGQPASLDYFPGTWEIIKVGGTVNFVRDGRVYQRQEMAAKAGTLTIKADGSYVWDSPSGVFRNRWRKATPAEMGLSYKGGEGLVLLKAKSDSDWIVFKRDTENQKGEGVHIAGLEPAARPTREYGWRK